MSQTYNCHGPTRQFTQPVGAIVIETPTTCCLQLNMVGGTDERQKMPGLGTRALLIHGKHQLEVWVSQTWGDIGPRHEEHRSVCTGTRLEIKKGTKIKLKPIPKTDLIKQADALLAKSISNKNDAWTLRIIIRSLWPYFDDPRVKGLCLRAEPIIELYVTANRKPCLPSLATIDHLFDQL